MRDKTTTHSAVVIGIDAGGTHSRAICTDLSGQVLARTQCGGGNPRKNPAAKDNIQSLIHEVLTLSQHTPDQVANLVAGFAGLNRVEDQAWAVDFTTLPAFSFEPTCVNDAVVAHAGAFALKPGIVAIGGTGSIVFGINEAGDPVSDYDFNHHTDGHARGLGYQAVFHVLAGLAVDEDGPLVAQILNHFGVTTITDLAAIARQSSNRPRDEVVAQYSQLAPLITRAAEAGVPLACAVCQRAVAGYVLGIRLVGSLFASDKPQTQHPIDYTLIGSVVRHPYIRTHLIDTLNHPTNHAYRYVEPALSPEAGAALMALTALGVEPTQSVIERLRKRHTMPDIHRHIP
ncbi:MAG: BadF/BadG/BcrA/BcrD ATPase family protein [Chloroflexota bacterium]